MTALQQLVHVEGGAVVADSRDVAQAFGKGHKNVTRAIDRMLKDAPELRLNFEPQFFQAAAGQGAVRRYRRFDMDRDGFALLAMGFTGPEALQWKLRYINAFNSMERTIAAMEAGAAALPAPERPSIMDDRDRLRDAIAFVRAAQLAKRCPVARRAWTVAGLPDVFASVAIETFGAAGEVDPVVTAWAEDRLEQAHGQRTPTCILFEDHQHWCNAQGIRPAGARGFSQALTAMGVIGFKSSRMQRLNVRLRTMGAV